MVAPKAAAAQAKVDLGSVAPGDEAAMLEAFGAIFKGPGGPYLIAIALGLGGFIIWLSLRLFLMNAATIAEGRIMAFSTWRWTKGDTLRILAAAMMVLFPIALVIGLALAVLGHVLGTSGFADAVSNFFAGAGAEPVPGSRRYRPLGVSVPWFAAPGPGSGKAADG